MTIYVDAENEMSFEVSLPSALLLNQNIDPRAIKTYGFIKSLTKAHGYCFASNEYLAGLLNASVSSVQRDLRSLTREGFLKIITEKTGLNWQRKIYLGDIKIKKCLRKVRPDTPPCQTGHPPMSPVTPISKSSISKSSLYLEDARATPPPPKNDPPEEEIKFQPHIRLRKITYEDLVQKHGKDKINSYIQELNDYIATKEKNPYQDTAISYAAALRLWIQRDAKFYQRQAPFKTSKINNRQIDMDGNDLNAALDKVF